MGKLKIVNPDFVPRVEFATRTGEAVAFMCILTYAPGSRPHDIVLPGFGAFVAVMVTEKTLGKTTVNAVGCAKGGAYACIVSKLVQLALADAPQSVRVVLTFAALALSSYTMARAQLPPMARKLGLSIFPLIWINSLQGAGIQSSRTDGPGSGGGGTFALDLLLTTLVGCAAAVAAGLLPWPSLAVLHVVPRRAKASSLLAQLLRGLGAAFAAAGIQRSPVVPLPSPAITSIVKRRALARLLGVEASAMKDLSTQAAWNPLLGLFVPFLLPLMLPSSRAHSTNKCCGCGNGLWPQELRATKQRLASVEATQSSLSVMEEAIHEALNAQVSKKSDLDTAVEARSEITIDSRSLGQGDVMGLLIGSVQEPLLALTEAAAYVLDMDASDDLGQVMDAKSARAAAQAECESAWASFDAAYYCARRDIYYPDNEEGACPLTADSLLTLNAFIFNLRFVGKVLLLRGNNVKADNKTASPPAWHDSAALRTRVFSILCDYSAKRASQRESIKIAVAMTLAGAVDHALLQRSVYEGQPAITAFTVAYLCLGGTVGTSFDTSVQRGEGTLLGVVFAALCFGLGLATLGDPAADILTSVLLVLFVIAASYIRGSATKSYTGTVAAFTAPVLMLAPPNVDSGTDATALAYSRIEQTLLGIVIWLVVEFGIWPRRATDEALSAVHAALIAAKDALHVIADVDLGTLDEVYAQCTPAEPRLHVTSPPEHTIEDGEEKFGDNGEGYGRFQSNFDSNPLGLFGDDHAATVDHQPPLAAVHSEVSVVHTAAAAPTTYFESRNADLGNGSSNVHATSPKDASSNLRALPALNRMVSGSLSEPTTASPMPYSRAHLPSQGTLPPILPRRKHRFSASNACAPTDAALKKVSAAVAKARQLAAAAKVEPELWRAPFPHGYVEHILSAIETLLGHMTTAHRALAATVSAVATHAHASNLPSAASGGSDETGSFSTGPSSGGDACRFLLDPLRPALKLAMRALAKAAADIIAETLDGTGASDASLYMETGNGGYTSGAAYLPLYNLKVAMAAFYEAFDVLCRSLQPAHARALAAALNKSTVVNHAGEEEEAPPPANVTTASTSQNSDNGGRGTRTAASTESAPAAPRQTATAATPTPTSPAMGATVHSSPNRSRADDSTEGFVSVMSNREVQAVNALVFSLLRCGQSDLPRLADAVADLTERQSLFS